VRILVRWQVQEAEQRFSDVLRRAQAGGPQIITRHGAEAAVIMEATEFHKLASGTPDLKDYPQAGHRLTISSSAGPATGRPRSR
jgi:prevent-host-death family protein